MKIEHTNTACSEDINILTEGINAETLPYGTAFNFAFFLRDDAGKILGGCNGSVIYGVIFTDQLWVHPHYRHQGWGTKLMERVHQHGGELGCAMATVCTMSFQEAQHFYAKLGYTCDFKQPGYAHGAHAIYLKKML